MDECLECLNVPVLDIPDVLNWVAAPHLPGGDHAARRHHRIRSNHTAVLEDAALHDDGVGSYKDLSADFAGVDSAARLHRHVIVHGEVGG